MNLDTLHQITAERDAIERAWRGAIKELAPSHSTREIAKHAGVSHVTVHKMTKGVAR